MSFLSDFPDLVEEFSVLLNVGISPESVSSGSGKKVWWVCAEEHEWQAAVGYRVAGFGSCLQCVSLGFLFPGLAAEWHPVKNVGLSVFGVRAGSGRKVWWLGKCGHEWQMTVNHRVGKGQGCPFCSNQRRVVGVSDLGSTHPVIAGQLHPVLNGDVSAVELSAGSRRRFVWLCDIGHVWEASVAGRVKASGCPVCVSLSVRAPLFAAEWHPTRNGGLSPDRLAAMSSSPVWWLGVCGHEWVQSPYSRHVNSSECQVCLNHQIQVGYNDLGSLRSDLVLEWHPVRNVGVSFEDVTTGSQRKVWWVCVKGHEWEAIVSDRNRGSGCPVCSRESWVSVGENEVAEFFVSLGLSVVRNVRSLIPGEVDIYVPELKFGVEFNGVYWHSDAVQPGKARLRHVFKYESARDAGVQLVQVWEDDWRDRRSTVLRALAHKLGLSGKLGEVRPDLSVSTEVVYARRTEVSVLGKVEAEVFLEANHIQGYANGSYYLGLKDAGHALVAVLVLKKEAGTKGRTLNIIRYATQGTVVGGFTKLLKWAEKTYGPEDFVTFADHTVSDGGLYESNGFVTDKVLPPDYMYVVKGRRVHKFNYRLKRFRNDPELLWEPGLTERELAALNGLHRVWDAGKTRYRKIL